MQVVLPEGVVVVAGLEMELTNPEDLVELGKLLLLLPEIPIVHSPEFLRLSQ